MLNTWASGSQFLDKNWLCLVIPNSSLPTIHTSEGTAVFNMMVLRISKSIATWLMVTCYRILFKDALHLFMLWIICLNDAMMCYIPLYYICLFL